MIGQQIREHDCRIHTENALGVQRRLGRLFRMLEKFQTWQIAFDLMVFRHVAARLPVEPDRRVRSRFTPACGQEYFVHYCSQDRRGANLSKT